MSEPSQATEGAKAGATDFRSVLKALMGKKVTIVNPESYEAAPVGFRLKEGFYDGKITGVGTDFITLATVFASGKKEGGNQPVKQFIPIVRIKRLSMMKDAIVFHM